MSWLHVVIDVPSSLGNGVAEFWEQATGWSLGPAWAGHPELRSLVPSRGDPYVHLQEIDGPPRVHCDLEAEDPDALVTRALELGAGLVGERARWRTLQSPGGLPFCVLQAAGREPPDPVIWPEGHRSRLVQVCIDAPAAAYDREVVFWRTLLLERWVDSPAPEFAGKWHDDAGSPLQLLFQRLDEPKGRVRAHLDLGTDDLAAEVRRLRTAGAEEIGPGRGWHALRDVAGLPFCVTGNSPAHTGRRDLA